MKIAIVLIVLFLYSVSCNNNVTEPVKPVKINHAPTVALIAPALNEDVDTGFTFLWDAQDIDNDTLTFAVSLYSISDVPIQAFSGIKSHSFVMPGMHYNTIYKWAVIADDGKAKTYTPTITFGTIPTPITASYLVGMWAESAIVGNVKTTYQSFNFRANGTLQYDRIEMSAVVKSCSGTYSTPTPGTLQIIYSFNGSSFTAVYTLTFKSKWDERYITMMFSNGTDMLDGLPGAKWTLFRNQ